MKGFILAAGLGTRLGVLTQETPKPLIPIASHRLIDWPVRALQKARISEIVVNLHYHGDHIRDYLTIRFPDVRFRFSPEETILGTGGGIAAARKFIDHDTFIIYNADIIADVSIADVVERHREAKACATMVTLNMPDSPTSGEIRIDDRGFVCQITGQPAGTSRMGARMFAGIHVVEPVIFDYLRPEFSSVITDFYIPLLYDRRPILSYEHNGFWLDIGSPEAYERATQMELAKVESIL